MEIEGRVHPEENTQPETGLSRTFCNAIPRKGDKSMRKLRLTPEEKKARVREQTRLRVAEWRAARVKPVTRLDIFYELLDYLHVADFNLLYIVWFGWNTETIQSEENIPSSVTLEWLEMYLEDAHMLHVQRQNLFRQRRHRKPWRFPPDWTYEFWRTDTGGR